MLALGSWVRPFWDSDQPQPEKIVVSALTSSPCAVGRPFAQLPASFISSYSETLEAPLNSLSPEKNALSLYFAFNEMTRLALEM